MKCKHKDGWILKEEIVINLDGDTYDIEAEVECNDIGCKKRKKIKFDICNVKEIENAN